MGVHTSVRQLGSDATRKGREINLLLVTAPRFEPNQLHRRSDEFNYICPVVRRLFYAHLTNGRYWSLLATTVTESAWRPTSSLWLLGGAAPLLGYLLKPAVGKFG